VTQPLTEFPAEITAASPLHAAVRDFMQRYVWRLWCDTGGDIAALNQHFGVTHETSTVRLLRQLGMRRRYQPFGRARKGYIPKVHMDILTNWQ
jgi:hypothetical protein